MKRIIEERNSLLALREVWELDTENELTAEQEKDINSLMTTMANSTMGVFNDYEIRLSEHYGVEDGVKACLEENIADILNGKPFTLTRLEKCY